MYESAAPVYLELMGRGRIAGHIKKADAEGFWEVTVPDTSSYPTFTKKFTTGAIFAIAELNEKQLEKIAENLGATPFDAWLLRDKAVDSFPDTDYDDEGDSEFSDADDEWDDEDDYFRDEDYDDGGDLDDDGEPEAIPDF